MSNQSHGASDAGAPQLDVESLRKRLEEAEKKTNEFRNALRNAHASTIDILFFESDC
jgi:hypothetical protein